jgi:hypothetical protein
MSEDHKGLYFALTGIELLPECYPLGRGVEICRTYVHLMAHPMVAFSPAKPGEAHPAPWKAVKPNIWGASRSSLDITVQLYVPSLPDRTQTSQWDAAGWIVFLLRLRTGMTLSMALIAEDPFASGASDKVTVTMCDFDFGWDYWGTYDKTRRITDVDLRWVAENWDESLNLMRDDRFSFALVALYHSHRTYLPELRIVTVWAALERLVGDSTVELRFRVSASIAAYLEPPGEGRFNLCRQLMKLYDYRSKAAHGQEIKENSAFESTMEIARRALVKMIEKRHVPSTEELRRLLFGWDTLEAFGPTVQHGE